MTGSTLLFFATFGAQEVGIEQLSIGTDRSLDEAGPIVRLQGRADGGGLLFDHTLAALTRGDVRVLLRAVEAVLAIETNTVTRMELQGLRQRLGALSQLLFSRERVRQIAAALAQDEQLNLADEGTTCIRCHCEHPAAYSVYRWGSLVQGSLDVDEAVDVALSDRGVPLISEPVIGPR